MQYARSSSGVSGDFTPRPTQRPSSSGGTAREPLGGNGLENRRLLERRARGSQDAQRFRVLKEHDGPQIGALPGAIDGDRDARGMGSGDTDEAPHDRGVDQMLPVILAAGDLRREVVFDDRRVEGGPIPRPGWSVDRQLGRGRTAELAG